MAGFDKICHMNTIAVMSAVNLSEVVGKLVDHGIPAGCGERPFAPGDEGSALQTYLPFSAR
jgi:hypothetical protein